MWSFCVLSWENSLSWSFWAARASLTCAFHRETCGNERPISSLESLWARGARTELALKHAFLCPSPQRHVMKRKRGGGEGVLSVSEIASSLSHLFHNTSPHAQQHTVAQWHSLSMLADVHSALGRKSLQLAIAQHPRVHFIWCEIIKFRTLAPAKGKRFAAQMKFSFVKIASTPHSSNHKWVHRGKILSQWCILRPAILQCAGD